MKVDIFTHILPKKYIAALEKKAPPGFYMAEAIGGISTLTDLDVRFRIIDKYDDMMQVLTLGAPAVEQICGPEDAAELAKVGNDEMAELLVKYPDKFAAAVASLPMNNMDAALKEADRAINDLKFKGVQIYTPINGKPIDHLDFWPLYEKMAEFNLPIWIHPERDRAIPDYPTEQRSKYTIAALFGWPYETTAAMTRLIFSGVYRTYPNIKFIVHHAGAMVPFFAERIKWFMTLIPQRYPNIHEHFRKFYNDTAVYGNTSALMCAYDYFGADHLLFGTDAPLGPRWGMVEDTIASIERMTIPDTDKEKILKKNAVDLLKLAL